MKKRIPIGIGDFKKLIEGDFYFVDKSLLIKDVIEDGAKVVMLPRPRRFGKTLNMSMLQYFFQKSEEDKAYLFKGLKVDNHKEIMENQGKYPVIFITFKDIKDSNFEKSFDKIKTLISNEYSKYEFLLQECILDEASRKYFQSIISKEATEGEYELSLGILCKLLYEYYKKKVIILIDEYDVPIQSGFSNNYYDKVIEFMRNFLSSGLKDNTYLEKAVLTGILRVAKESIFSGLNNLKVCTILNPQYSQHFGFSHQEIEQLLEFYGEEDHKIEVKDWYNGYRFGNNTVYNPWSILNYIDNSERG